MKKILLISAILLALASFSLAAEPATQGLQVYSGWNLIPNGFSIGASNDSLVFGNAKYVWSYSNLENKYYGGSISENGTVNYEVLPNNSLYSNYTADYLTPGVTGTSSWVYFARPVTINISTSSSSSPTLIEKKLFKGWNFLSITQAMIDSKQSSVVILQNCNVERAYAWYADTQSWGNNAAQNGSVMIDLRQDFLGKTVVVKVAADCQLSNVPNAPNPPSPPGLP